MKRVIAFLLLWAGVSFSPATAMPNEVEKLALIPTPQQAEITDPYKMALLDIRVKIDPTLDLPAEGYILETRRKRAEITAKDERGAIWGRRTLEQLVDEKGLVPQVKITDWPAFSIRGFMHDTGRNFMPVEMLKKHLDILSRYKINTFHWHLTDYPAWRIESRAYPELNDPQYQRKGRDEGKFYTYGEIRELIAYARERGIMIIPEIDMPGHSTYFNSAFGFGMSDPRGMKILETCIKEFFEQVPATDCPYLHIGSDEVHIPNPVEFMAWADSLVRAGGRIPMVWDPGLPLQGDGIRQIWSEATAKVEKVDVEGKYVDSYMGYLNLYDPAIFLSRMLSHNPCGKAQGDENALGGILCLWNDVRVEDKKNITRYSDAWSGLLPFAERFWTGGLAPEGSTDVNLFPDPATPAGKAVAQFEKKMSVHKERFLKDGEFFDWVPNACLTWRVSEPVTLGTPVSDGLKWHALYGGSVDLDAFRATLGIESPDSAQVWAEGVITVPRDTVIRAWIGFEVPARSNRVSVGIGKTGEWEADGKVWVNGQPVEPPMWNEPGAYGFHFHTWHKPEEELAYTDEQFYWTRRPAEIALTAGENTVLICAPKRFALQRWSFVFQPHL